MCSLILCGLWPRLLVLSSQFEPRYFLTINGRSSESPSYLTTELDTMSWLPITPLHNLTSWAYPLYFLLPLDLQLRTIVMTLVVLYLTFPCFWATWPCHYHCGTSYIIIQTSYQHPIPSFHFWRDCHLDLLT